MKSAKSISLELTTWAEVEKYMKENNQPEASAAVEEMLLGFVELKKKEANENGNE